MQDVTLQVSDALDLINQTLDEAFPFILIEGEVASFKVNQGKFVFFDIKDSESSLGCFMMSFALKFPIEDGMKVRILAQPKLTKWGKFSLTVREVMPVGEGSLKKSYDALKAKLELEGLFDEARKRKIPAMPVNIGVISSSQAAGYADFIKILENRWGGLNIKLIDVVVQGIDSPASIIGALSYLNELSEPLDAIAIIRGGGSADDLATFNHEGVVRAVASSRYPVIVGVGHEVDVSLCDLAADVRAATPSNAAEILVPDKKEVFSRLRIVNKQVYSNTISLIENLGTELGESRKNIEYSLNTFFEQKNVQLSSIIRTLKQLDPEFILKKGYVLVKKQGKLITKHSDVIIGDEISLKFSDGEIGAKVNYVS